MNNNLIHLCVKYDSVVNLLANAFKDIPAHSPILVHSDIAKVGYLDTPSKGSVLCEKYERIFSEVAGDRTLLFPTFNYSSISNRKFDLLKDFGEVGALSKYFAKKYPNERTQTPGFSFYIKNNRDQFSLEPNDFPFGKNSTMEKLHKLDGYIIVIGLPHVEDCMTFGHYVETLAGIGYRYNKSFMMEISDATGKSYQHEFNMHVRPLGDVLTYETNHIDLPWCKNYGTDQIPLWVVSTREYVDYHLTELQENELAWLSEDSKTNILEAYKKFGRPLMLQNFELSKG